MMKSAKFAGIAGLALALAACGGASDEPAAPSADESPAAEAAPAPAASETAAASAVAASEAGAGAAGTVAAGASEPASAAAGDPPPAPIAFAQCKACHSVEPGKMGIGPSLAGVYGTKAAEIEGYQFSTAMQKSGLTWDDATLDTYLENPQKVVPGTKMSFFGLKDAAKRKDVIAYLKTLK